MFSEREEKIISIIGRKKTTIDVISSWLFNQGNIPLDPEIAVGNSIRRIIKKCEHNKLKWTLVKRRVSGKLLISKEKV